MTERRLRSSTNAPLIIAVAALCLDPFTQTAAAQTPIPEASRARLRAMQASNDPVEVILLDGTTLRGRVIETADDTFVVAEERIKQRVTAAYIQLKEVRRWEGNGLSNAARMAIVLGVTGAVFLVFCAAPFPLGFLCHDDPS